METFFKRWHLNSAIEVDVDASVNILRDHQKDFFLKSKNSIFRLLCRAPTFLFPSKTPSWGQQRIMTMVYAVSLCLLQEQLWVPHRISTEKNGCLCFELLKKKKGICESFSLWFPALTNFFQINSNRGKQENLLTHTHSYPRSYSVQVGDAIHFSFILLLCIVYFPAMNLYF